VIRIISTRNSLEVMGSIISKQQNVTAILVRSRLGMKQHLKK